MDWRNGRRGEQRPYLIFKHQQWTLYGWLAERNFLRAPSSPRKSFERRTSDRESHVPSISNARRRVGSFAMLFRGEFLTRDDWNCWFCNLHESTCGCGRCRRISWVQANHRACLLKRTSTSWAADVRFGWREWKCPGEGRAPLWQKLRNILVIYVLSWKDSADACFVHRSKSLYFWLLVTYYKIKQAYCVTSSHTNHFCRKG